MTPEHEKFVTGLAALKESAVDFRELTRATNRIDLGQAKEIAQDVWRSLQSKGRSPEMSVVVAALMFEAAVSCEIRWSKADIETEDLVPRDCLYCNKTHYFKPDSNEAQGVFNVFCPDEDCEDSYAADF